MTTIDRIKEIAKKRGWSLQTVADKAGLGINTIYRWNEKTPSTASLKAVADVLNVSTAYLLGEDTESLDGGGLTENQKLIAYSIDPDVSADERDAIIEMVQAAMKFRRRI